MFIKICGITSVADARIVAEAGAHSIGLNFYPMSPRFVQPGLAFEIIQSVPTFIVPVGLFVEASADEVRTTANLLGLKTLQIHGNVTPELIQELGEFSIIAAHPLRDRASVDGVREFVGSCRKLERLPSAILVDAQVEGKHGGTGQIAPWDIAREIVLASEIPVILAGGLTAKNVADAISAVGPWGVDVSSGVEVAPGRKESYKVRSFIDRARRAQ